MQANLARDEDCERVVEEARAAYGPVDILINNAAVAFFGPTMDLPVSRWTASWRVTVHATFLLSKLVLPGMIEQGWGRIVNVTSESAIGPGAGALRRRRLVGDTAYGAQKAAIERFSQGLAEEVYPSGVGVAAIAPSLIVPTPGRARERADHRRRTIRARRIRPTCPTAIRLLVTDPLEQMAGRVVYSQQLLLEKGLIETGRRARRGPGAPRDRLRQRPRDRRAGRGARRAEPAEVAPLQGGAGRCEMWSADRGGRPLVFRRYPQGVERDVVRAARVAACWSSRAPPACRSRSRSR